MLFSGVMLIFPRGCAEPESPASPYNRIPEDSWVHTGENTGPGVAKPSAPPLPSSADPSQSDVLEQPEHPASDEQNPTKEGINIWDTPAEGNPLKRQRIFRQPFQPLQKLKRQIDEPDRAPNRT